MRRVVPESTEPGCGDGDLPSTEEHDLYAAWLDLARIYVSTRLELDRAMQREAGIGLAVGEVLFQLVFAPGQRLRMSDLAHRLNMAQSGITRVVDRLVEDGLVVREIRPSNRRTTDACLTPAGRRAFEGARPVYMQVIRERFGPAMTAGEAARLRAALRSVLEGVNMREEAPWADRRSHNQGVS